MAHITKPARLCISILTVLMVVTSVIPMQPQLKSIIRKPNQKKHAKRVTFSPGTMYVCWDSWRRRLYSECYLPLTPLFDPSLVGDLGLIEVEELMN